MVIQKDNSTKPANATLLPIAQQRNGEIIDRGSSEECRRFLCVSRSRYCRPERLREEEHRVERYLHAKTRR